MLLAEVLEQAQSLSLEEKEVFKNRLIEEKREKIYQNYLTAKENYENNQVSFTKDINKIKKILEL
ncbi:MAG TPA: hypothetical protein DHW82_05790 [Spirochaetia bacterium]|nr:MAG: hypothetical protein A2Y41_12825 [Spirochaetes bacterium GWB1_36_13]HCL56505.1 hypothetical protein [Spirochaetia bacterium]